MTLKDLVKTKFGVDTSVNINPLVSSVGTTAVEILPNNPNRLAAIIVNLSANSLYVLPDTAPTSTRGIQLVANGGALTLLWDEEFDLTGWSWFAIASGAASSILVLEVVSVS